MYLYGARSKAGQHRSSDIRKITPPFLIEENGSPVLIHVLASFISVVMRDH